MVKNFKALIYHLFMSGTDLEPLLGINLALPFGIVRAPLSGRANVPFRQGLIIELTIFQTD